MSIHENLILYSFRRCPYAMRARLGILASGMKVELREVVLRDKPCSMLEASPKGTVPVMILPDATVLEESLDIIDWAMANAGKDSEAAAWVTHRQEYDEAISELIAENDSSFKAALDAYKYPEKFPDTDRRQSRETGGLFITKLNAMLEQKSYLFGEQFTSVDASILPFVRQFAHVDQDWFYNQPWENVIRWLDDFKESDRFKTIMPKFKKWEPGDEITLFGGE